MTRLASRQVTLRWTGDGQHFRGGALGGPEISIDGDGAVGPSPMETLALSVAGCMAIDVLMILEKSRVPLEGLEIGISGERADDPPRRFTSLNLVYRLRGPGAGDRAKVERAVRLSRETYCSVLHTLQPDLELDIEISVGES